MFHILYETCAKSFITANLYVLQVFFRVLTSWPVCARTRAQLRGNIEYDFKLQSFKTEQKI